MTTYSVNVRAGDVEHVDVDGILVAKESLDRLEPWGKIHLVEYPHRRIGIIWKDGDGNPHFTPEKTDN